VPEHNRVETDQDVCPFDDDGPTRATKRSSTEEGGEKRDEQWDAEERQWKASSRRSHRHRSGHTSCRLDPLCSAPVVGPTSAAVAHDIMCTVIRSMRASTEIFVLLHCRRIRLDGAGVNSHNGGSMAHCIAHSVATRNELPRSSRRRRPLSKLTLKVLCGNTFSASVHNDCRRTLDRSTVGQSVSLETRRRRIVERRDHDRHRVRGIRGRARRRAVEPRLAPGCGRVARRVKRYGFSLRASFSRLLTAVIVGSVRWPVTSDRTRLSTTTWCGSRRTWTVWMALNARAPQHEAHQLVHHDTSGRSPARHEAHASSAWSSSTPSASDHRGHQTARPRSGAHIGVVAAVESRALVLTASVGKQRDGRDGRRARSSGDVDQARNPRDSVEESPTRHRW